jgi:hypothetical protein
MHRRKVLAGLGALPALTVPVLPIPARAATREATPATFAQVVREMASGGELLLAGGDYGSVRLEGRWPAATPLVIRSRDPADPALLQELMIIYSRNVRLEQLVFDYRFRSGDLSYTRPFQIRDSADISVRASLFTGDRAGPGADVAEGFSTAFGLSIHAAERISILANEFLRFGRAIICSDVDGLVVRSNDLHALRSDGLNCVAVRNTVIEGNHFHDFQRDLDSGDHADMIQFWTARAVAPTRNVVIRDNLLNAGQGEWTQSIFMRNEMVDTGEAGEEMFYRNLEISNNVIVNAHLHGISVGETDGLIIANNTLVRNAAAPGQNDHYVLWSPRINVNPVARNVVIARNVSAGIAGHEDQSDWLVLDNVFVQDRARAEPGFYLTVFNRTALLDPTQPGSFVARPGGPLDGTGIGATWLNAGVTTPPSRF